MKNLVFYLPLHYPDKEGFFRILELLDQEEAGYLEIGIPVSDPFMDGDVIRETHKEILARNITPEDVVDTLKEIKRRFRFKVVLMTYKEGVERFRLAEVSKELYHGFLCVDGDYPPETFPNQISVLSKSYDDKALSVALKYNQLFAYVVSGEGKTGSFESLPTEYIEVIKRVKSLSTVPAFVGFGIKSARDVKEVVENGADGAIIGTEFIKRYQMGGMDALTAYIEELKEAV
jgi:tryptophan synthase alpha chain